MDQQNYVKAEQWLSPDGVVSANNFFDQMLKEGDIGVAEDRLDKKKSPDFAYSGHGTGDPGILARRRRDLGITSAAIVNNTGENVDSIKQEPSPVAPTKQAGDKIDDFVTFEPDGRAEGEIKSTADPQSFDEPVEGFADDKITAKDKTDNKPQSSKPEIKPDADRNAQIAQAAMNREPVTAPQTTAAQEKLPNDGGGLSEFEKIKTNNVSDAVPADLKSEMPNLAEQPVVTIDQIDNVVQTQGQISKPNISQPPITEQPKEVKDPNEIPITVTKTQDDLSAIAPAGEERFPQQGNGVDDRVAEIQSRIREGDGRFNDEVRAEITENQEGTIAPPPDQPGVQMEDVSKPEIHIDGQPGVIGEIKPKEEGGDNNKDKDDSRSDIDHQKMAGRVTGNEDASFFAKLTGRWKEQNQATENLKKAA